ncbi:MAG TPA: decarboxylating 6-phosphogluconate dehydrogenase [Rhizomicrobium sp.]|nr:decarboxylating 6-phosphogluconate dehydrogenase [Rhizomicrobium sp.]
MIGLGRMGANMVQRLVGAGHDLHVYSSRASQVQAMEAKGAKGSTSLEDFVGRLTAPRAVWLMIPAAAVDEVLAKLMPLLKPGDTVIDGGNSYYHDDLRRAGALRQRGLHYVDVGVSGGVWGLERGYCQMIGGEPEIVERLDPIFRALAPGVETASRTPGASGIPSRAEQGYLHCGPNGAGHFVKMVHNGIEYGLMAAFAEGFGILKKANIGNTAGVVDAETTPLRNPEHYKYDFDVAQIAEVWRRGSVVSSWLLDLTAHALRKNPELKDFSGRVSDSGEGRWTLLAAIDEGVPAPAIASALFSRFSSRGDADYADKLLSALRFEFGGHVEVSAKE